MLAGSICALIERVAQHYPQAYTKAAADFIFAINTFVTVYLKSYNIGRCNIKENCGCQIENNGILRIFAVLVATLPLYKNI
jgi:hypothetical protein